MMNPIKVAGYVILAVVFLVLLVAVGTFGGVHSLLMMALGTCVAVAAIGIVTVVSWAIWAVFTGENLFGG